MIRALACYRRWSEDYGIGAMPMARPAGFSLLRAHRASPRSPMHALRQTALPIASASMPTRLKRQSARRASEASLIGFAMPGAVSLATVLMSIRAYFRRRRPMIGP